jgi:hypothetical protein
MATALSPSPFAEPEPMVPLSGAGLARPPSLGGTRRAASNSELQIADVLAYLRVHHGAVHPYYRSKTADWELRELLVFESQLASRHSKRGLVPPHMSSRTADGPQRRSGMSVRNRASPSKGPSHMRIPKRMGKQVSTTGLPNRHIRGAGLLKILPACWLEDPARIAGLAPNYRSGRQGKLG